MSQLEDRRRQIERMLSEVIDPETGLSIMRMDLIHELQVRDPGRVSLVFRPSSPVCPMAYSLGNSIRTKIQDVDWVTSVAIKVENFSRSDHLEGLLNG
ncbi:MAG: iron-sulfur cluster assembly protein [Desulfomonile tiedjei]|nr:iron-sulfur cluster assembly protein [Desulfomonile tiedjei]